MAEKKDGAPSDRIDMVRALGRELFGGPSSGPGPGDAARRFLYALEAIGAEYADDDHRGYVAALAAVDALCLLLGRPDLGERFRDLGKGLADLHGGQEVAPILRRPEGLQASGRNTVDWDLAATACAHLVVLVEVAGMTRRAAAESLTETLRKEGVAIRRPRKGGSGGGDDKDAWRHLDRLLDDVRAGRGPSWVREKVGFHVADIRKVLGIIPPGDPRKALLLSFGEIVRGGRAGGTKRHPGLRTPGGAGTGPRQ